MDRDDLFRRVEHYAARRGLVVRDGLGSEIQGSVFAVEYQTKGGRTAVKGHLREVACQRERDVYLRLRDVDLTLIRGCQVPSLVNYDDELWCIEMSIVTRPFVLDFASAQLDEPPDFSEEVMADWRTEKQEQFGSRWPEVIAILDALERYGIFMTDAKPGNISFEE
jgi:hypothetical protein